MDDRDKLTFDKIKAGEPVADANPVKYIMNEIDQLCKDASVSPYTAVRLLTIQRLDNVLNALKENSMPGRGHRFTEKEDRQAQHIAASERAAGKSPEKAKAIGYATVVKGGGGKGKTASRKKR